MKPEIPINKDSNWTEFVQKFTKEEVIQLINELLERPDILIDAVQNENTNHDAKSLFELALKFKNE